MFTMSIFTLYLLTVPALLNGADVSSWRPDNHAPSKRMPSVEDRIIGGTLALDINFVANIFGKNIGTFGYELEICANLQNFSILDMTSDSGMGMMCSGSIISSRAVLTAAHCFPTMKDAVKATIVFLGSKIAGRGIGMEAMNIIINKHHNMLGHNDIAVIVLNKDIEFSEKVSMVQVAPFTPPPGTSVWAAGFGSTDQVLLRAQGYVAPETQLRIQPKLLNKVELTILPTDKCQTFIPPSILLETQICAYAPNKDTCQGDSGGPLFTADKKYVVGVTSLGFGCGDPRFPGIYTEVKLYDKWIKKAISLGMLSTGDHAIQL